MKDRYDVVVLGAGVAGAVLAWKLSTLPRKPSILLLDGGDNPMDALVRDMVTTFALSPDRASVLSPYARLSSTKFVPSPDSGVDTRHYVQASADKYKSNYVRMIGGSTWAWRGNCPRWVEADFELATRYGVADDWPIKYGDIETYFGAAEKELGVSGDHAEQSALAGAPRSAPYPMPAIARALGDQMIKANVDGKVVEGKTLTVVATPQARNSLPYDGRSECKGNANCIPICPSGAKYDATVHLKRAAAAQDAQGNPLVEFGWHRVIT